jgi:hypothetical protein
VIAIITCSAAEALFLVCPPVVMAALLTALRVCRGRPDAEPFSWPTDSTDDKAPKTESSSV